MRNFIDTRTFRTLAMLMATLVFSVGVFTSAQAGLIVPNAVQPETERVEDLNSVRQALENKVVTERLKDLGLSQQEIDQRLAMLSDEELSRLAQDVQNVDTAGSALGIIASVAIVTLIVLAILEITGDADNF